MTFSCLFSLSTNDNIIMACKVAVVLRDFQHICDLLLVIFFFFLWLKFFRNVLIVCITHINPTIYEITIIMEDRY